MNRSPRLEAETLAAALPATLLEARRLAASAPGVHGRRRAGQGEDFWQFREHAPEDGARAIDWRRSARGDRYYVREHEREAAQSVCFWIDPGPGFDWSSGAAPSKRRRALTLCLALAIVFARAGERVGALGGPGARSGGRAVDRLLEDLSVASSESPANPPRRSAVVYAADFYDDLSIWRSRLASAASDGAVGALLAVSDPAEEDFPFRGRTRFERPGGGQSVLFGRAESAQSDYVRRLAAHRAELRRMADAYGFVAVFHRTDRSAGPALSLLTSALQERR